MTSSRRCETSREVASSCGAVLGITVTMAASPASLTTGSPTAATPGAALAPATSRSSVPSSCSATASTSGPLKPAPKPSARRS